MGAEIPEEDMEEGETEEGRGVMGEDREEAMEVQDLAVIAQVAEAIEEAAMSSTAEGMETEGLSQVISKIAMEHIQKQDHKGIMAQETVEKILEERDMAIGLLAASHTTIKEDIEKAKLSDMPKMFHIFKHTDSFDD